MVPLKLAVTFAGWLLLIVAAVAMNVLVVEPEATVTEGGTVTSPLSLETLTETPVDPAPCDSVTVQVDVLPVPNELGLQDSDVRFVATRDTFVCCEDPLYVAVTVADWLVAMEPVVAVNVPLVDPEETDTVAGTTKEVLLLETATTIPPAGAD